MSTKCASNTSEASRSPRGLHMRYNCFRNSLTCCRSKNENKILKLPIAAQECQTANRPHYRAVQIVSLKDHDCFKNNMLTYLPWMSVTSVIACLYSLSGTFVCPWWTHLFSIYTHHNLILLFVLDLSFLSILRLLFQEVWYQKEIWTWAGTRTPVQGTYLLQTRYLRISIPEWLWSHFLCVKSGT